jgi:hypothetical protein
MGNIQTIYEYHSNQLSDVHNETLTNGSKNKTFNEITIHIAPKATEFKSEYLFSVNIHKPYPENVSIFPFLEGVSPRNIAPSYIEFVHSFRHHNEKIILISLDELLCFLHRDFYSGEITCLVLEKITCVILFGNPNHRKFATDDALELIRKCFPNAKTLIINCPFLMMCDFSILENLTDLSVINVEQMCFPRDKKELILPINLKSFVVAGVLGPFTAKLPENQTSSLEKV